MKIYRLGFTLFLLLALVLAGGCASMMKDNGTKLKESPCASVQTKTKAGQGYAG